MQELFCGEKAWYTELDNSEFMEEMNMKNYKILSKAILAICLFGIILTINITTLIISKKPGNTGISRDIRTEFTTDLLLSD